MRLKKEVKLTIVLVIFIILLIVLFNVLTSLQKPKGGRTLSLSRNDEVVLHHEITIMATGDYLIHNIQYLSACDQSGYCNFDTYTQYLTDIVSQSDVAIFNYEGTLAQDIYPLGGYPLFNAPNEVLEPMVNAGFNVAATSNNHSLDSRLEGVVSTLEALENYGIASFGTTKEYTEEILVKEVNGIKIAFLSYSYGFNGLEGQYTQEQLNSHVSFLDEELMEKEIKMAEELADLTVVYPHWGDEYHRYPNDSQVNLAHKMVDWGADLVLGSHPHVLQPTEMVIKDGQKKFIIYSMGNFVSNQRLETLNNHYTEQGIILEFKISKSKDQSAVIDNVILHPTWVHRVMEGSKATYWVLPTELENLSSIVDVNTYERITNAHQEIIEHLDLDF